LILHDLLDAVELVGGVMLVVGVPELPLEDVPLEDVPFEDVPFVVSPTKLAIGGPGKTYGADVSKT